MDLFPVLSAGDVTTVNMAFSALYWTLIFGKVKYRSENFDET